MTLKITIALYILSFLAACANSTPRTADWGNMRYNPSHYSDTPQSDVKATSRGSLSGYHMHY